MTLTSKSTPSKVFTFLIIFSQTSNTPLGQSTNAQVKNLPHIFFSIVKPRPIEWPYLQAPILMTSISDITDTISPLSEQSLSSPVEDTGGYQSEVISLNSLSGIHYSTLHPTFCSAAFNSVLTFPTMYTGIHATV